MSDPRQWTVPGSRETARIAWRARVTAAAREAVKTLQRALVAE